MLHDFWVPSLSPVFIKFVSARLFLKNFKKVLHQRDSWAKISSSGATLNISILNVSHLKIFRLSCFNFLNHEILHQKFLKIRILWLNARIRLNFFDPLTSRAYNFWSKMRWWSFWVRNSDLLRVKNPDLFRVYFCDLYTARFRINFIFCDFKKYLQNLRFFLFWDIHPKKCYFKPRTALASIQISVTWSFTCVGGHLYYLQRCQCV